MGIVLYKSDCVTEHKKLSSLLTVVFRSVLQMGIDMSIQWTVSENPTCVISFKFRQSMCSLVILHNISLFI